MPSAREEFATRLATRDPAKTEAQVQADLYGLLTVGGLNLQPHQVAQLEFPTADGTRRRLDIEIGHLAIEVKKDLRAAGVKAEAEVQLAGYVSVRATQTGSQYAGLLTDGTTWLLYNLTGSVLSEVASLTLSDSSPDVESLASWLEAVLATQTQVQPTPQSIRDRLGATSPSHLVDHAALSTIYHDARGVPEVQLKRELWSKLLRTASGSGFDDTDRLFVDHTLLVLSAEIIAHAVLGFDVSAAGGLSPRQLVLGSEFAGAQIRGVVQADFFDWVLDATGGEEFVANIARRIAQFDWSSVEHDVLKVLYESIIEQSERKRLGEYYTPDWLADRVVATAVDNPLAQTVLDPACGSGTFLFHAIRSYLSAAEASGQTPGAAVKGAADHVWGMDIHPVAVTLARVTYLLAIGRDRLNADDRTELTIPVYLGDSLQWEQRVDVFAHEGNVTVSTEGTDFASAGELLFDDDLIFPKSVIADAEQFDRLVDALAEKSGDTSTKPSSAVIEGTLTSFGVHESDRATLTSTFDTMRRLHAMGRDHIWGYYVRNLIRPIWLADGANHVDVLIGNPPWLAYSKMTKAMQKRFTVMLKERGLVSGGRGVSGRDLSTLFVVRTAELYLKMGGRFAFVMPHGVLRGQPHDSFRSGVWNGPSIELSAAFDKSWDLSKAATGFPATSCVLFGTVSPDIARRVPTEVSKWVTSGKASSVTWAAMAPRAKITDATVTPTAEKYAGPMSPYKKRFRQGAVLAPRLVFFVEDAPASPLGPGAGRRAVRSSRSSLEKGDWAKAATIAGNIEKGFVRPLLLGATAVPFGLLESSTTVLPIRTDNSRLLTQVEIDAHAGLANWWQQAAATWDAGKSESDSSSLLERANFMGQLAAQVPGANQRVVYTASGNRLAAARVADPSAIIEHKLYWAAASSESEALYLCAILNSDLVLNRLTPFQNVGLFGARDIDKNVFHALIPIFEPQAKSHVDLVTVAREAEALVGKLDLSGVQFQAARKRVRDALRAAGVHSRMETLVEQIVPTSKV